ncbi:N-formylglutamate amidohydrolase [Ovoidimarina sediminis]|uniref:N-formylglutamate amidohydrolase n=1 Tax=Ovoidimarina sediminis TaxID=3079856 RepID=UPI002907C910|nr:N-formylglutamate amidohydrolase [Rhodophyticola sp. MJ-SS7]MDU8943963.1 N-formylglutamate amidohydrolase [Rhodophyticola sp. MJ-SS7]
MSDEPFEIIGADRQSPWLIACDHATNRVPPCVGGGTLGLSDEEMSRHIAWDVGAAGVTRGLAEHLGSPAILSRFSRLVIDPNRGEDDPTLIMRVYDRTIVPGNRHIDETERERRLNAFYRPYHAAYAELAARRRDTLVVAVHSFTPQLRGRQVRPWHVGVLFDPRDERLSRPFIDRLYGEGDLVVGENEPYAGHLPGDAIDRHGLIPGRPNVLIELRHDLIDTAEKQARWAARLAPLLEGARTGAGL